MLRKIKAAGKSGLYALPSPLAGFVTQAGARLGLWGEIQSLYCRLGCPRKILSGPFQGMAWEPADAGGAWLAKIIGTYEMELHSFIHSLAKVPFDTLVDIGCADGYYALGLFRLIHFQKIVAYDTDPYALECLRRNAAKNQLSNRIETKESCSGELLELDLKKTSRALVISDCEGAEREILDPKVCPSLSTATLLVEVHDFPPTGPIGTTLRERFRESHEITSIQSRERSREDLPPAAAALNQDWELALDEERKTRMEWILLQPRQA